MFNIILNYNSFGNYMLSKCLSHKYTHKYIHYLVVAHTNIHILLGCCTHANKSTNKL